jgi:hypothetical protein
MPFYCGFLVNSNGFQNAPSILCHSPLFLEIDGLLRLIRGSEQLQGCFLEYAPDVPRIQVPLENYGVVEGDCDVEQLAI